MSSAGGDTPSEAGRSGAPIGPPKPLFQPAAQLPTLGRSSAALGPIAAPAAASGRAPAAGSSQPATSSRIGAGPTALPAAPLARPTGALASSPAVAPALSTAAAAPANPTVGANVAPGGAPVVAPMTAAAASLAPTFGLTPTPAPAPSAPAPLASAPAALAPLAPARTPAAPTAPAMPPTASVPTKPAEPAPVPSPRPAAPSAPALGPAAPAAPTAPPSVAAPTTGDARPEPPAPAPAARPSALPLSKPTAPTLPEPALAWRVEGEWIVGQTAGGNPEHESWVSNEQYQLHPHSDGDTEFKIVLRQELPYGTRPEGAEPICFFIVDAIDDRRKRRVIDPKKGDPFRLIKVSGVRTRVELKARTALARAPLPYLLVPCTHRPNVPGTYTLEVTADKPFVLHGPLPVRAGEPGNAKRFTPTAPPPRAPPAGARRLGLADDDDGVDGEAGAPRAPARARGGNARGVDGAAMLASDRGAGYTSGGNGSAAATTTTTTTTTAAHVAPLGVSASRGGARAAPAPDPVGADGDAAAEVDAAVRAALEAHAAARKPLPFEDARLPPSSSTLYGLSGSAAQTAGSGLQPPAQLTWLRPARFASARASLFGAAAANEPVGTMVPSPHFENRWLLATISAVGTAPRRELLSRVLAPASYAQPDAGIAAVRLWTGEAWEVVIVDDLFPCAHNRCAVGCSADPTALWVSVVEKAFVKRFAKSYDALAAVGDVAAALVALTGGVAETVTMRGAESHADLASGALWARLLARVAEGALLVARTADADTVAFAPAGGGGGGLFAPPVAPGAMSADGLLPGSFYTVQDCQTVMGEQLVCLRNLWGIDEWRGHYSDSDAAGWSRVVDGGKSLASVLAGRTSQPVPFAPARAARAQTAAGAVGVGEARAAVAGADGIFWMSFSDFAARFDQLVDGRPLGGAGGGAGVRAGEAPAAWPRVLLNGRWDAQSRGGSLERSSWRVNPQFRLAVHRPMRLVIKLAPTGALPDAIAAPRHAGAPRARVGWALLRAMTGTQRKVALAPSDILKTAEAVLAPLSAGAAAEIELAPTNGAFGYVLVAYCEDDSAPTAADLPALSFALSAFASLPAGAVAPGGALGGAPSRADWSLAPIEPGDDWHAVTCAGQWEGATAGGCPNPTNQATWLLNPHFSIAVSRSTRVQLLLDVPQPAGQPPIAVGALLLSGRAGGGRKKVLTREDICAQTGYQRVSALSAECLLEPSAEPYWLLASTFEPGVRGTFALTLYSDSEMMVLAVSGGGAVYRGARAAGASPLNLAPNQPLPPLAQSRANLAALPTAASTAIVPAGAPAHPAAAAAGAADAAAPAQPDVATRALKQALDMKEARIAELERRLSQSSAAMATAAVEAEAEAQGPRPTMLDPPPTADEMWPHVVKLGQGVTEAQKAAMRAELRAIEAKCRETGAKWEDPRFHASDVSLPPGLSSRVGQVTWLRPEQIAQGARLWVSEWEIAGVTQGALNDRHFISAANIVASNPELIHRVFLDTSLAESCGCYVFRFHGTDSWDVVTIDDRLPCGPDNKPLFARCPEDTIFWLPLLEKAYAKFVGGYDRLDKGGTVMEALEDLTGSTGDKLLLTAEEHRARLPGGARPDELWSQLLLWLHSGYVIGCQFNVKHASMDASTATAADVAAMGIEPNRAYAVLTGGQMMGERLLRLRAPSHETEWRGDWSDKSDKWTMRMRQMLNYREDESDGTFWISWDDFVRHFNKVYAMRMLDDMWTKVVCRGTWAGLSAGGATNFPTWRHNPQWVLRPRREAMRMFATLTQLNAPPRPGDDDSRREGYANAIGLYVFRGNPPPDDGRRKLYLADEDELIAMREPAYKRTISLEFTVEPSDAPYVIMPCTFEPGCEGQFSLTIHCDDLDDDGVPDFDLLPVGPPRDWFSATVAHAWKGDLAGGARVHDTWRNNPQFYLIPSARSRVFIFLDLPSASADGAAPADDSPPIQLCVARGDGMVKMTQVGAGNLCAESEFFRDDGLSLELSLGKASRKAPYVIIPCTRSPGEESRFSISVYSEHPFEFASFEGSGKFPLCTTCQALCPQLGSSAGGPLDLLLDRLSDMEGRFVKLEKTRYWEKIPLLKAGGTPLEGVYGVNGISRPAPPPAEPAPMPRAGPSPALDGKKKKVRSSFCTIL